jgi:hypothetical protein
VSVKKRNSINLDGDDIHDNALSSTTKKSVEQPVQDYFTLGSPYPGTDNASTNGTGRIDIDSSDDGNASEKENLAPVNAELNQADDMTARTELDLLEDDKSSQTAPMVPPKEVTSLPMKKVKGAHTAFAPIAGPRTPTSASFKTLPSRQHSYSGASSTPSSAAGDRRLSLLAGGSLLGSGSSPSTSPSSIRTMTPTTAHNRASSSANKIHPVKRMSLSYVPSPVTRTKFSGSLYDSPKSSLVGTPPASASSTSGYFGRMQDETPSFIRRPSAGNILDRRSPASLSPTMIRSASTKREDGETVMTQHMDILGRIAQKERKILDLKELLAKEERDLRQLQKEWQTSVNRELIASRPEAVQANGQDSVRDINSTDTSERMKEANQADYTAATDSWKVISAKLAGAGNQLNAFIDQLAAPLPDEGRKSGESVRIANAGLGLDVLQEEAEEADVLRKAPPAPLSKIAAATTATTSRHAKRVSVFGNSMAVLQKQVEAQFGVVDNKGQTANGEGSGWGAWQKRLKEARENASGLLAKAEAKIGQALTLDELPNAQKGNTPSTTSTSARKPKRTSMHSPSIGGNSSINFGSEDDQEKAALAELSYLNSLAGINMSGTTDRVVTSQSPESLPKKTQESTNDTTLTRKVSNSSRRESSQSQASTSRMTSATSATTITSGSHSPPSSFNDDNGSKEQSFLSMISNGWTPDMNDDKKLSGTPVLSHKRLPSNGHSKTRMAAEVALQERRVSQSPAQDDNGVAWGLV